MVVIFEAVGSDLAGRHLFARRRHVQRVPGACETDVHDAPALAYRQRHCRSAGRCLDIVRMFFATPVLHHETEIVRIEEEPLGVARTRWTQVDKKDDWELEALRRVNRQQRDRLGQRRLLGSFTDGEVGVDYLVEVAHEIADAGQGEVALEPPRELEDLAQVEQRAGAAVTLGAKLSPPQVTALLEQAVEDIGDGERIAQQADAVGELDQPHGLGGHLRLHLRKALHA